MLHRTKLAQLFATSVLSYSVRQGSIKNDPKPVADINKERLQTKKKNELILIAGNGNKLLANNIAQHLGIELTPMDVDYNFDREIEININSTVNGKDVFIIQPCASPVNDKMMELMLAIACAKRAGARKVTAVVPYFGYKYHRRGQPISTKHQSRFLWSASSDFSQMLSAMGVDRIIAVDIHRPGQDHEACFFDSSIPVESVSSIDLMVDYIKENIPLSKKVVIVSSNTEYIKKSRRFQESLKSLKGVESVGIAAFLTDYSTYKNNDIHSALHTAHLLGDVDGADVIITDEVVESAGTLAVLCRILIKKGAKRVYLCASHGLFTKDSMELIRLSPVEKVIVTDSLPLPPGACEKIVQVSVAPLLSKVIDTEFYSNTGFTYRKEDDEDFKIS